MDDLSGNGNDVLQLTPSKMPTLTPTTVAINGASSVLFDGNDELITSYVGNSHETLSFGLVFNSTNTANSSDDIMLKYGGRGAMVISRNNAGVTKYFDFIGGSAHLGHVYPLNSWVAHTKKVRTVSPTSNKIFFYENGVPKGAFTAPNNDPVNAANTALGGNGGGGATDLNGGIAEFYKYSKELNATEQIIINNYFSAKYNLPLTVANHYTQDDAGQGDFDHHVAGIGQEATGDNHTDSQGTGIIRINNPSALADGDYLFWGEETKNATYDFTTITADYTERLNSVWRVSKVGDLGAVSLNVKASDLDLTGMGTCTELKLIVSNDANFTTKTVYDLTLVSGVYTATGVNFTDADYFTFEYGNQIVLDDTTFYNGSTTISGYNIPDQTDGCKKLLVKTSADGDPAIFQVATVKELEVEVGGILVVHATLTVIGKIILNGEIRLIGNAQLIQTHTGVTQNSGTGKLYIDATSNLTNIYQSSYWTSPVVTPGATTFTVANVMKDGSTPTALGSNPPNINFVTGHDGATGSPITISNFWLNKLINDVEWADNGVGGTTVDENTAFNPAEGYNMKSSGANKQNFTFVGIPNDGDYSSTITTGNSSLLGNPYPSAMDADKFITDNTNIFNGTLYFWDGADDSSLGTHVRSDYAGGYATRVIGTGTAFNTGVAPTQYIAIGQGFFVDAIGAGVTGGTINFNNAQRLYSTSTTNYRRSSALFPTLRVGFEFDIDNGNVFHRHLAVAFRGLTNSYEAGYDAVMYDRKPTDISLKVDNNTGDFVITGTEDYSDTMEIPLHVRLDQQRNVTFSIDAIENFTPNNIYLKDAITGMYHDLTNPISLNLPIGDYANRFSITFTNSVASVKDMISQADIVIVDNTTSITILSEQVSINNIAIFNVLGQNLAHKKATNNTITMPTQIDKGQFLLIKIELENGQTITKKWIKK